MDSEIITKQFEWFDNYMLLSWFKHCFTVRKQTVQFKSEQSEERPVNCVPQGSILGPLLFMVYVNELPKVCSKSKVILYAEDTAIYAKVQTLHKFKKTLNSEMSLCSDWFTQNKLQMFFKLKVSLFGTSQRLAFT